MILSKNHTPQSRTLGPWVTLRNAWTSSSIDRMRAPEVNAPASYLVCDMCPLDRGYGAWLPSSYLARLSSDSVSLALNASKTMHLQCRTPNLERSRDVWGVYWRPSVRVCTLCFSSSYCGSLRFSPYSLSEA